MGKQTYQEYLESIKEFIYAEPGEVVTCSHEHYVMECATTLYIGNEIINTDFHKYSTNFSIPQRKSGCCGKCGSYYVKFNKANDTTFGNVQFFINGIWRERKYK